MKKLIKMQRVLALLLPAMALWVASPPGFAIGGDGSGRGAPWVGNNFWGGECQGSKIPFGPYDYRQRSKYQSALFITEEYHFTKRIQNLQQDTATSAINDIQYTLMAWPNHHGALWTAYQYRLQVRGSWDQNAGSATPVECHLQRAINFSPKDPIPYMIQGLLLHEFEHYKDALKSFRKAHLLMPNDVITQYNMALTMVVLKLYEEAVEVAEQVYSTDFPLPGLKKQLTDAGYWPPGSKPAPPQDLSDPDEMLEEGLDGEMTSPPTTGAEEAVSAVDQEQETAGPEILVEEDLETQITSTPATEADESMSVLDSEQESAETQVLIKEDPDAEMTPPPPSSEEDSVSAINQGIDPAVIGQ